MIQSPLHLNDSHTMFYMRGNSFSVDASQKNKTITNSSGGVAVVSVPGMPGGSGVRFYGGNYLSVLDTPIDFDLGYLFTIDTYVSFNSLSNGTGYQTLFGSESTTYTSYEDYWTMLARPNGGSGATVVLQWRYNGGAYQNYTSQTFSLSLSTPTHFMLAGNGTTMMMFKDGKNISGSMPTFYPLNLVSATRRGLTIGGFYNGGSPTHYLSGDITALRVSKGICRATAAGFVAPNRLY